MSRRQFAFFLGILLILYGFLYITPGEASVKMLVLMAVAVAIPIIIKYTGRRSP